MKSKIHSEVSGLLSAIDFLVFWLVLYVWYVEENWVLVIGIIIGWIALEVLSIYFSPLVKVKNKG